MDARVLARGVSHKITWFVGKRFAGAVPLVFVLGYPKSGTTWACQLLGDVLGLPFPKDSLFPIGCAAVVHGHETVSRAYPRGVYVVRDARDALTSQYFHALRTLSGSSGQRRRRLKKIGPELARALRDASPEGHAERFTLYVRTILENPRAGASPVSWGDHVMAWKRAQHERFPLLRYEDLLSDGAGALSRACAQVSGREPERDLVEMALNKFSFERQAGRRRGEEDRSRFLRKGQAGDWVNHFTPEAAKLVAERCGEGLRAAGYETDDSWAARFASRASGGAPA